VVRLAPSLTTSVLMLFLMGAAACGSSRSAKAPKSSKTAAVYSPFSANGGSLLHTKTKRGSCMESITTDRRDAWNCSTTRVIDKRHSGCSGGSGHHIVPMPCFMVRYYDPCFSSPRAPGIVLCPDSPWKTTGVLLKLTRPLPANEGSPPSLRAQPWALELVDGRRCSIPPAPNGPFVPDIDGQRANYECDRGRSKLWGYPNRHTQPWTIFSRVPTIRPGARLRHHVAIRQAWM
jgi:hypothetical protein